MLPATSAGKLSHDGMATGKVHGVMSPTTPIGILRLIANLSGSSAGTVSPSMRRPSPAAKKAMSMPSCTSPRASASTLPISRLMARAKSSLRSAMSPATL